jgi:putative membrane protein
MEPKLIDWSRPQRQPWAGFAINLLHAFKLILRLIWPVLLLRLFKTESDEIGHRGRGIIAFLLVIIILSVLVSFIQRYFFRFFISGGELQVRKGWLKKEVLSIPLERIQSVEIEEDLLHRALNLVKLRIDTAGSARTEAKIDALRRPMAEALRDALLQNSISTDGSQPAAIPQAAPVLHLSAYDLMRLSLTANHLEAFVLLLTFSWGLYDDLRPLAERFFPGRAEIAAAGFKMLLVLAIFVLVITFLYSALRMMMRFFDYRVLQDDKGFSLRFGLIDRRQRLVPFEKIQYLEWRASWLRRLFGLWLLELQVVGDNELKAKQRLEVPLTRPGQVIPLAAPYHVIPATEEMKALRIHPVYPFRRLLIVGLLPVIVLLPPFLYWGGVQSFWMLLWPLLTLVMSTLRRRKFRLWMFSDVLYLRGGLLGESFTLLKWYKIQSVKLAQSPYQRSHALASVELHTAAGKIRIPWIPLAKAQEIMDYALYKVESEERVWM